jgi:hypothetical protein
MSKSLSLLVLFLFALISCGKNDPAPDLSYLCNKGGIWLVDKKDSFNPQAGLDTFFFSQAGGYHRFVFTNSGVNRLQVDVLTKPDSGQTFIYKAIFVREISGTYITEQFNYATIKDSMLTIENKGSSYLVSLKPVQARIGTTKTIELRACNLKMTDVTP